MLPRFRVFISSPADVDRERQRAQRVIERLNGELAHVAQLEAVRWETRFYSAHRTFQDEIPEASACDVVISIFWTRIGSPLPDEFPRMPAEQSGVTGEKYPSGSAYETLTAIAARTRGERPDVYVFRKTAPPVVEIDKPEAIAEHREQWTGLEAFFQRWFRTEDGKFLSAYHAYRSADDFELAVERLLRDWVHSHVPGAASIVWPIGTLGSPFRGLAAFDARHAPVYFGRDLKVSAAIDRLKAVADAGEAGEGGAPPGQRVDQPEDQERRSKPFLLIVGPSGSGKSSLARAGVAPRLTTPGVVSTVDLWRIAVMRPGDGPSPFRALADALNVAGGDDDAGGFGKALPELAQGDMPAPAALAELLAMAEPGAARPLIAALDRAAAEEAAREGFERSLRADLLLIVDQLEDIFGAGVSDQDRAAFAVLLGHLAATQRIWIVATLRGDLYQRLIAEPAFLALKDAGATCDLAPPGREELEEIVRKSASAAGLIYETDPKTGARLDDTLLQAAEGQDVLPLLQFTLEALFEARAVRDGKAVLTFEAYRAMGGLDGAIDQAAEAAMGRLGEAEAAALPRLLRLLAAPLHDRTAGAAGPLALTVRPAPFNAAAATPVTRRLVDALVASRVLLVSEGGAAGIVRVAHQRVIESWTRAHAIVESHRDFYRIREEIEQQHERWSNGQRNRALLIPPGRALAEAEDVVANYGDDLRPELHAFVTSSGRRARLRQTLLGLSAVVFAIVAAVAIFASVQARQAEESAEANYRTARGTVDSLIGIVAGGLRDLGVPIATVDTALNSIRGVVDRLGASAAKSDPEFNATRAGMLYEFAKTYQRSAQDKALEAALESLGYRRELAGRLPLRRDLQADLAASLEQVGDLTRYKSRDDARRLFSDAKEIRLAHHRKEPDSDTWAVGVSNILVRIGDLDGFAGRWDDAFASYQGALDVSIGMHLRKPADAIRLRELSWGFNKIGDVLLTQSPRRAPAMALEHFEKALCIRRQLAESQKENLLWQADVSWTLDRVGRARRELGDLRGADDAFLEAWTFRLASGIDRRNTRSLEDLYLILSRIADHKLDMEEWRLAYAFYLEADTVLSEFKLLKGDEAVLQRRRNADAIVSDPGARRQKARQRLSSGDAELVESEPTTAMLAEKVRIEGRLVQLRAGREACVAELTEALRRTAAERRPVTE